MRSCTHTHTPLALITDGPLAAVRPTHTHHEHFYHAIRAIRFRPIRFCPSALLCPHRESAQPVESQIGLVCSAKFKYRQNGVPRTAGARTVAQGPPQVGHVISECGTNMRCARICVRARWLARALAHGEPHVKSVCVCSLCIETSAILVRALAMLGLFVYWICWRCMLIWI